jgi:hypothetical protein
MPHILVIEDQYPEWMLEYAKGLYPDATFDVKTSVPSLVHLRLMLKDSGPTRPKLYDAVVTDLFCPIENAVGGDLPWVAGGMMVALLCQRMDVPCTIVTDRWHHDEMANPWCLMQRAAGLPEFVDCQKKISLRKVG